MDKEFLESFGLDEAVADAIWQEHQKVLQAHETQLEGLRFSHAVESAVQKAGGRNIKAVTALLDLEALQKEADIPGSLETALKALKKENGWLFESAAPAYAPFTGADTGAKPKAMTLAGALRERMRK